MDLLGLSLSLGTFLLGLLVSCLISIADSIYEKSHDLMLASSTFHLSCSKPPNRLWDLRVSVDNLLKLFITLIALSFVLIISILILVYLLTITRVTNQAFVFLCLISYGLLLAPIYHRIMQVNIGAHIPQYLSEEDARKLSQEGALFDVSRHINELETFLGFMKHMIYVYFVLLHVMVYFSFSLLLTENLQFPQILLLLTILLAFYVARWLVRKSFVKDIKTSYGYITSRRLIMFLSTVYWLSIILAIFNIGLLNNPFNNALTIFFVFCYIIIDSWDGYFRPLVVLNSHKLHGLVHRSFEKSWIKLLLFVIALLLLIVLKQMFNA